VKVGKKRKIGNLPFIIWLGSLIGFFSTAGIGLRFQEFQKSNIYLIILFGFVAVGIISFILGIAINLYQRFIKKVPKKKQKNKIKLTLIFVLYLSLFPFVVVFEFINPISFIRTIKNNKLKQLFNKKYFGFVIKKIGKFILSLLLVTPIWGTFYLGVAIGADILINGSSVEIIGQSMLPTLENGSFPKLLYAFPFSKIEKGSIVVFQTGNTIKEGELTKFIKRVVATEGDRVSIRNGYLHLNGSILEESYTKKPRSTFGNSFLADCKEIEIPKGYLFVMGDNRAASQDSRELGFISAKDINSYLPISKQKIYQEKWRDASLDTENSFLPSFKIDSYYQGLNDYREKNNLKPFKTNERLEKAAQLRAQSIIDNNELSTDIDDQKYSPKKSLNDAKYYNTISAEINTRGYYDSEDLLSHWTEYKSITQHLLNPQLQEAGIGFAMGQVEGCDVQVIVQSIGGYVPPNYSESDIQSWENSLLKLKEILPSWENIRNYHEIYNNNKSDADRLIEIINIRISRIQTIVNKMRANQWLTSEENKYINEDASLYNEQEGIASRLNSQ